MEIIWKLSKLFMILEFIIQYLTRFIFSDIKKCDSVQIKKAQACYFIIGIMENKFFKLC